MKVAVIRATDSPMHAISEEAGMCYGKTDYNPKRVERCLRNGHTSVAEHVRGNQPILSGAAHASPHGQLLGHEPALLRDRRR